MGCIDASYLEYDAGATIDDGSCVTLIVEGCTNANYVEYNPNANVDDGSCVELIVEGCTDANACNYNVNANTDNGSCNDYPQEGYDCDGNCLVDTDGDGVCDEFEIVGCQDQVACAFGGLNSISFSKKNINFCSNQKIDAVKYQTFKAKNLAIKNTKKVKYQKLR